ncbi:MAG: NUDIX hydrolase [Deltaproteobacteria bacterium]|nr:NUDIX hydrolase [Deltaproteobacteria bacterium]
MTCGRPHRNPVPTVDTIIQLDGGGIVLIKRKNRPQGWALPGGFVDYGETVEHAAVREAKEETGLEVELVRLLGVYSDPSRDSRQHTISTVFVARASGTPVGGDDAAEAAVFNENDLPTEIVFDHRKILDDYFSTK